MREEMIHLNKVHIQNKTIEIFSIFHFEGKKISFWSNQLKKQLELQDKTSPLSDCLHAYPIHSGRAMIYEHFYLKYNLGFIPNNCHL